MKRLTREAIKAARSRALATGGEARYRDARGKDMQLDEVVASSAHVHVERMSDSCVWLGLTGADGAMVCVSIYADRAHVRMLVTEGES